MHAQRGKVIDSVVIIVSMKIARFRILGKFASAKVSEIERKHAYLCQSCPKGTAKAINRAFILLVTPISHIHINYLHMHECLRMHTLAIDQYSKVV